MRRNEPLSVSLSLANRGFAVCHNPRPVYITLIDAAGRVVEFLCPEAKPGDWHSVQPGGDPFGTLTHCFSIQTALPPAVSAGHYQIGLWLPDASLRLRFDPRYAIRLANGDVPWWVDDAGRYGINLFGVVEVQ